MSRFFKITWLGIALMMIGLASCSGGSNDDPSLAITQAWRTVEVAQTQTALYSSPTPGTTDTPAASPTMQATNTPQITNTPLSATTTATHFSLSTPGGSNTGGSNPAPCDNANFIKDVNYTDFAEVTAGKTFDKTWRFENLGPCDWTTQYHLVYSYVSDTGKDGVFTAPSPESFPKKVLAGEQVDLTIAIKAPTKAGTYQVVFVLQNDKGYLIPLVNMNSYEFWVIFVVK
jgi:hypothetical protein